MSYAYKILLGFCFSCLTVIGYAANLPQNDIFFQDFWHPKYRGERLDYCDSSGESCGKKIADEYCKLMGFDGVSQQIKAYNIGVTNYLSSALRCKGWRCSGFSLIRCVVNENQKTPPRSAYRIKRFVVPRIKNYRVAWCYDKTGQCGRRAAYSFCRRMGYSKEYKFSEDKEFQATKRIGDGALCFGKQCSAFLEISCQR